MHKTQKYGKILHNIAITSEEQPFITNSSTQLLSEGDRVIKTALKILALLAFLAAPCAAEIIVVDQNWPYDFNNIQAAINDANDGDFIFVFPGTYTGPGNRDIDFLGKAITVRSILPDDPCIVAATVIDCNSTKSNPHNSFIFDSNEDSNSVLEGLKIIRTHPDGILCENSSPIINNCSMKKFGFTKFDISPPPSYAISCNGDSSPEIIRCKIKSKWGTGISGSWSARYVGSGVYCGPNSTPEITSCLINECHYGIDCYNESNPVITDCTISNEIYYNMDFINAGIHCGPNSNPQITDCLINKYNHAISCEESSPEITNCTMNNNRIGIYCYKSSPLIVDCNITPPSIPRSSYSGIDCRSSSPTIINCVIRNYDYSGIYCEDSNSVITSCTISGSDKSGIHCLDSNMIITGCAITDNANYRYYSGEGGNGGGIYCEQAGILNINDCTITGNIAESNGGGIYCAQQSFLTLDNCTIAGNSASESGGGIYCEASSHVINDCNITGNSAYNHGGGIYCINSDPEIINCNISGNSAGNVGGGIYCEDSNSIITGCTINENTDGGIVFYPDSSTTITGCTISGNSGYVGGIFSRAGLQNSSIFDCIISANSSTKNGGGIYNFNGIIQNCTISGNSAQENGGGISSCSGPIINCTISDNTTNNMGGGVYNCPNSITNCTITNNSASENGGGLAECNGHITGCTISGNSADYEGGGLYNCDGTITDCIISDNSAVYSDGGGLYYCYGDITNCSIIGNYANDTGGGIVYGRGGKISNCSIIGNYAELYGGAVAYYNAPITNTTIADNAAGDSGGALYKYGGDITNCIIWDNIAADDMPISSLLSSIFVSFTDLQVDQNDVNVPGGITWGPGNIDIDPCFIEPGYWADINDPNIVVEPNDPNAIWVDGDYHLLAASPCINTGDPNYIPEPNETDIDGDLRVMDGRLDMGADEFGECMAITNPDYNNWLYWNKPDCWCYSRQCRGDSDGLKTGPFWINLEDLKLIRKSINLLEHQIPEGGICADFDHQKLGAFWVSGDDMVILRDYISKLEADVPLCADAALPNETYNFWITP